MFPALHPKDPAGAVGPRNPVSPGGVVQRRLASVPRSVLPAWVAVLALALLLPAACDRARPTPAPVERKAVGLGATLPEDGQWTMPAKDYQATRFSGLSRINTANVARLQPAWTFATGVRRGHGAAPRVVGSTI
jgi:glucose dehydrogenase